MKIYREESLSGFEFWSGAKDFAEKLTDTEFDQIEDNLTGLYPDGMDETQINDLFWFEPGTVCEWLGLDFSNFSAAKKFKVLDYWPEIGISETELDGRTRLAKSTPEFSIDALSEFNRGLWEHQKMQRFKK